MKVCIAEKPSVAREIANILGARTRHDGFLEGNGYQVTWTFGHLCGLKAPDDYRSEWKRWDLNTLPLVPEKFETKLIGNKGSKKQFGVIKKLLKKAEMVINCGDAGQEGELIQRWVIKQAGYKGRVLRLWISSLTPEAIRDGFQNLQPASQYDNLYFAGSSRAVGDWLLGMNATRLYTLKFGGYKQVLSIGRVQTPTLAMLVARHHEIENFVPQPYWELQTIFKEAIFNYSKGKFDKKEDGEKILKDVEGQPFTILSVTKKKGLEYPPRLFDLTSLQVHCNKRFGYSADQTLKTVQKLYEQKLVTYPRVDTTYLPDDVYPKIPGILKKLNNYSQFTQPLLGNKIRKSAKVFNNKKVTDHHAIIPTGVERILPTQEQNIYDAITRRFIAAFYPNCEVSNTTIIGESAGHQFKATGKEIIKPGWRVLYPKTKGQNASKNNKEKDEKILPSFKKGDTGPHEPNLIEKMTQPPKLYTEATLLRAMETAGKKVDDDELRDLMKANGIGRPSTRANIIETLFRRKYTRRQKKNIIPTDVGIQLIGLIKNDLLKSVELTGQWEKQLREIESGEYSAGAFVGDMKQMISSIVEEVRLAPSAKRISATSNSPSNRSSRSSGKGIKPAKKRPPKNKKASAISEQHCPKCRSGHLLKGKTAYGCSRWKEGCDFRLPFTFMHKKISERQLGRLIKRGSTIKLKGFKQHGGKVDGKIVMDKTGNLSFVADSKKINPPADTTTSKTKPAIAAIICPKCKTGKVVKGKTAYGCSRWKAGCDFRYDFEEIRKRAGGKVIDRAFLIKLFEQ